MRRSVSEAYLLPQNSPSVSDREVPLGSKSKRLEPERVESMDNEPPKRRRTTIGGDRERLSSRLSIDRADAPSFTSRARLPSPLPRQSMPGLLTGRRSSVIGSPMPVSQFNRGAGSPRASPRPQTPTHPKFVDLLRRDPSQQHALDSARTILDTLDRVTTGGAVGGSARKYRPPQPLRPMRFKSLSSSRPVSLHDMLTGAVSSAPPSPAAPAVNKVSPLMQPLVLPGVQPVVKASPKPSVFGAPAPVQSIFGGPTKAAESPKMSFSGFAGNKVGESPKRSFTELVGNKGAESPRRELMGNKGAESPKRSFTLTAPARQPSPLKKVALAPVPPVAFQFGDPSKFSDADFIDEECFAPNADDSSGSESEASPANASQLPSIFGAPSGDVKSIFGSSATPSGSIFGTTAATTATDKKVEPVSIFGASAVDKKPTSIFGAPSAPAESKTEATSIFGGPTMPAVSKTEAESIFGGPAMPAESKSQPTSIFGAPSAPAETKPLTTSIFGAPSGAAPAEPKTQPASIFGGPSSAPVESKPQATSFFGGLSAPAEKTGANDTVTFGGFASTAKTDLPSSFPVPIQTQPEVKPSTPANLSTGSIFGEPKPSTPSGSLFGATDPRPSTPFGGAVEKKPEMFVFGATPPASPHPNNASGQAGSLFGQSAATPTNQPAQPSIFGSSAQPTQAVGIFGASTQPAQTAGIFVATAQPAQAGSVFGAPSQPTQSGSVFGASAAQSGPSSSIFGGQAQPSAGGIFGSTTQPTNIFGSSAPSQSSNVFGASQASAGGMFGQPQPLGAAGGTPFGSQPNTPSNLFGAGSASTPSGTSIFGNANSGSMFGSAEQSSSAFSFGASAGAPTGGDNPFAASGDEFGKAAPKRKILKAARRT